jgi:hypothetical protein
MMAGKAKKNDAPAQADNDDMRETAAEVGHNSEMTAEERKALFMSHYRPIAAQLEKVREQQAEYKRLRKLAKADKIALWELDYALKCAEVEDENIIPDRIKREAEIAAWFALPVEYQPDMFGDFTREPGEDRARREGRKAGATGVGGNPYDEHSPMGRAWAEEWSKEQEKARAALLSGMEKRNSELIKSGADDDADPFAEAAE